MEWSSWSHTADGHCTVCLPLQSGLVLSYEHICQKEVDMWSTPRLTSLGWGTGAAKVTEQIKAWVGPESPSLLSGQPGPLWDRDPGM